MREELIEQINVDEWLNSNEQYDLVLSDDIDSLVSCAILNKVKGYNINYFYDFRKVYAEEHITKKNMNKRIWVDVDLVGRQEIALGNHATLNTNNKSINPNIINNISKSNYFDKYAGSVALLLWSVFDLPLPESEEGKMLLLCIDVAYKGFYDTRFKEQQKYYLTEMFGLTELYNVIQRHTKEEFESIFNKYGLKEKINMIKSLNTYRVYTELDYKLIMNVLDLDFDLTKDNFKVALKLQNKFYDGSNVPKYDAEKLFSLARTYRNKISYSIIV